jgi:serine/threonine protein kinase
LQLLEGIEWLHGLSIVHRDVKMSNLLLNDRGILKIADFGMARNVGTQEDGRSVHGALSPRVITLWYRAPEVLFGDTGYGIAVDVWAVGCVLGELLIHQPLLPGKNEENQVDLMVQMFGAPNNDIWPGFTKLPMASRYRLADQPYDNVKEHFPYQVCLGVPCQLGSWFHLTPLPLLLLLLLESTLPQRTVFPDVHVCACHANVIHVSAFGNQKNDMECGMLARVSAEERLYRPLAQALFI